MLRHCVQIFLRGVRPVLYFGAAGVRRGAHRITIRMDQRPQPLRLGLSAGGLKLFVAQCSRAALADAARRKDLYQVGAVSFELAHSFANLFRGKLRVFNRFQRSQKPWSGQPSTCDRRAQLLVLGRSHALNRGEPGHQCGIGIPSGGERSLISRLVLVFNASVRTKVPCDVIMQVDPSRHHRHVSEIVSGSSGNTLVVCVRLNADDLAGLHHDQHIVQRVALAIQQGSGADHHRLRLCVLLPACKQR